MNDFSPSSLLAIAQEALGLWLPVAIAGLVLVLALHGYAIWTRARMKGTALRISALVGVVVAIVAMAIAPTLTQASFGHLREVIDYILLLGIGAGAFVATIFVLTPILGIAFSPARRAKVALG